jgi:hypothetical protein
MTLITTPGAADADSYASLADADAYFAARGIATWTGTDDAKEAALRRGTSYLDNQYAARWRGIRTGVDQSLAWPRSDGSRDPYHASFLYPLLDSDGVPIPVDAVPVQIQRAAMEAALLIVGGATLEPNLDRGNAIKSISKGVGPLRKDIVYQDGAPAVDRYLVVEGLLTGFVTSTPGSPNGVVRLVRA